MTKDEINALVSIINRVPMTPAEAQWMQSIISRFVTLAEQAEQKAEMQKQQDQESHMIKSLNKYGGES